MAHVLLIGGLASSLVRFRGPFIDAALAAGHVVTCAAGEPDVRTTAALAQRGVAFHPLPLERTGTDPREDWQTLRAIERLMRRLRPDVALGYTVKPALYTVAAARHVGGIRAFAMLSGLGSALSPDAAWWHPATISARLLARLALPQAHGVFFHNHDDFSTCEAAGLVRREQGHVVAGSGVDLPAFPPAPWPAGPMTFLFVGRLLRDKGIVEFVDAARLVQHQHRNVRFRAVGDVDANPHSITGEQLDEWRRTTCVEFPGAVEHPYAEFAGAHVFVLPSYAEGLPRTALEAMAVGRAIITTDVPGCRDTVRNGNGLLVPVRNASALAEAMCRCIADPNACEVMGQRGRVLAETVFDARRVAADMLHVMGLDACVPLREVA